MVGLMGQDLISFTFSQAQMRSTQDLSVYVITCALQDVAPMIPEANICAQANAKPLRQPPTHGATARQDIRGCHGIIVHLGRRQVVGGTHGEITYFTTDIHGRAGSALITAVVSAKILSASRHRPVNLDMSLKADRCLL